MAIEDDVEVRDAPGSEVAFVAVVGGSREAQFTAFVRTTKDPLHRMAYLLCGDAHRAEELTQHTFERVWRSWDAARAGDPLAYARRVLANLRIDTWRRHQREILTDDVDTHTGRDDPDPSRTRSVDDHARRVQERDAVVRALLLLPVKQRRVVVLRHLLDLPEAQVADELGVSLGTVKASSSRGLARLRDILTTQGADR
ncbi:SigE family RNA polymerase sigma factor [Oerskovia flava]|uniref:SigE family RNA polymerase sigma factor n=1 Tax=Oerskovia flava TaxID=2986422 RepID=UPI00223FF76B|nr:SigE family RNA polymerase sigma factor [Oerskovia sp. JB1-3-2]